MTDSAAQRNRVWITDSDDRCLIRTDRIVRVWPTLYGTPTLSCGVMVSVGESAGDVVHRDFRTESAARAAAIDLVKLIAQCDATGRAGLIRPKGRRWQFTEW